MPMFAVFASVSHRLLSDVRGSSRSPVSIVLIKFSLGRTAIGITLYPRLLALSRVLAPFSSTGFWHYFADVNIAVDIGRFLAQRSFSRLILLLAFYLAVRTSCLISDNERDSTLSDIYVKG